MAGGYKLFSTGEVLTAANVNNYLMKQTVMVFASSAARTTALSGVLAEGMFSYLTDTNAFQYYDGASWADISNPGDITAVTAGTGLTGGGTSGAVTLATDATIPVGWTTTATAAGTTTLTATSNTTQFFTGTTTQTIVLPVTSTLILGQAFVIQNNSTGALTVQSSGANTVVTIPAGNSYLLTCILTSGTTAASWDAVCQSTSLPTGMVQISQTVLSSAAASIVLSSIPSTYTNLKLVYQARGTSALAAQTILLRINADTGANYDIQVFRGYGSTFQSYDSFAGTSFELGSIAAASAATGLSGSGEIEIPNYKGTSFNKSIISNVNYKEGTTSGNMRETLTAGYWRNSAAITSLTLLAGGNNLDIGTVVTLYGEL